MKSESDVKQQVREFYDRTGWQQVSEGCYQNAAYEDLRPVSHEYIHRCHVRVLRHLKPDGRFLLDAGSGPVQYPEYLEYSKGYQRRICADISLVALQEARRRIGDHGLFVVADIANLPFKAGAFEGVISLHTIHHLPADEHLKAYQELHRVLSPGSRAVVVNGWHASPLMGLFEWPIRWVGRRSLGGQQARSTPGEISEAGSPTVRSTPGRQPSAKGTFVQKHDAAWLVQTVGSCFPLEIWVWRSVNVGFLRAFIRERLGERGLLRILFWLEERFPHFLGKYGQYPLIVLSKGTSV